MGSAILSDIEDRAINRDRDRDRGRHGTSKH